ncbi:LEAF RUST 10 DISEASE-RESISTANCEUS RECEPTOR-LIKE PROTEIN KINASE-like 2.1 [Primulina eburnea]|uniref:LEAF RUST 10 DISEASE-RESISTANCEUS RECEPTOR-LIKE PROTEIN KINASE-like 2.1 n=1 Tax=Primulina eburnea TaxID=1245227 RepID=UPI003C6C6242
MPVRLYEMLQVLGPILQEAFDDGFSIQLSANNDLCERCVISGGVCGYNQDSRSFTCYCIDGPHAFVCNSTRTGNGSRKVISGDHKDQVYNSRGVTWNFYHSYIIPDQNTTQSAQDGQGK